ncbi:tumor necrosis factor ligand superfamily member 15-like [Ruditapes philippinarum]|uniref:tumor necrosis factor ligand superfamily member 15-like n=1 Tax=Ruditapes philippinarum TaxID=129788 RepID=UPI00295B240B|nr:tumor necrosis factor ligand superfamily member 15-like [Ruditapes philippinarum]
MDKKLKISVIVVLLCIVICLTLVLALVWSMPDLPTTEQRNQICLSSEFGPLKCGKTSDMLADYLGKTIGKQYDEAKRKHEEKQQAYLSENSARLMNIYDKHFWEMKPAAKLTGKEQPPLREIDIGADMVPIREWCNGRELYDTKGFIRLGIRYRNGRLVVPVDGTYFIYSNLDFFEESNPSSGLPDIKDINKPIKHGIFKFNILEGEEKELVSNVQPHTISTNRYYNSYNSYVSSLAELKAGDELSVKVSNISYIRYTKDNYFGVNLI